MPAINPNDPRQPYEQIADHIRQQIKAGTLKPGDKIPSGRALAADFNVAHMTAANALRVLKDEGLITSWQGRGAFVRDDVDLRVSAGSANMETMHEALIGRLDELQEQVRELANRVADLERRRRG